MLVHRLRRWPNIETASSECLVFGGRSAPEREQSPYSACNQEY